MADDYDVPRRGGARRDAGRLPPVLVLHGGLGFIESMHYQIRALARTRFVVALDSRGHGRSTDGEGPLRYERMTDDVLALLDHLDVPQADVVGWSDGGIIGLVLAMKHPARVGKLMTCGSNYHVDGIAEPLPDDVTYDAGALVGLRMFYRYVAPEPEHWPSFFEKVATMWQTEPTYRDEDLGRIAAPVLVVAGEHDSVALAHTQAMAAAIPDSRLVILPDTTHLAPVEDSTAFNDAMIDFLDE